MLLQLGSQYVDKEEYEDWWVHLEGDMVKHTWQGPEQYNDWYWLNPDPKAMDLELIEQWLEGCSRFNTDDRTASELYAMYRAAWFDRPYYPDYDVEVLQIFVRERKLLSKHVATTSKRKLIQLLRKADREPRFERLMDLPEELRKMIYKEYMEPLGRTRIFGATQPPLTRVSRQAREESLPLFYNMAAFGLALLCGGRVATAEEADYSHDAAFDSARPISGHCHLDHHYLETGNEEDYEIFHGVRSWAFIPKHMVDWHQKVYFKYVKEIHDIQIFFPHMCLDMHIGWDKKSESITMHTHGHCEHVHGCKCGDKVTDQELFDKFMMREKDAKHISLDMLKQLFIELDERNKVG